MLTYEPTDAKCSAINSTLLLNPSLPILKDSAIELHIVHQRNYIGEPTVTKVIHKSAPYIIEPPSYYFNRASSRDIGLEGRVDETVSRVLPLKMDLHH